VSATFGLAKFDIVRKTSEDEMTTITDDTHYTSYDGSRQSRADYETAVTILAALTPLIGGEAYERIRRAAYCGGLDAALKAIQRVTGVLPQEPNNRHTLSYHMWFLDITAEALRMPPHPRQAIVVPVDADDSLIDWMG
jgi:hypothetical protein